MENVKREYVHSTYCRSQFSDTTDMLVVKEYLHFPDGRVEPNLRFIPDYERSFWVTQKNYQDHEQKKEFEMIYKVEEYKCIQAQLVKKAGRALKLFGARTVSDINASPYIYGTDITTPVLLAEEYRRKWPELVTEAKLAIMDYETDVNNGTNRIISGSVTFKDRAVLAVTKDFLGHHLNGAEAAIQKCFTKHLQKIIEERNLKLEIVIVENAAQVVCALFKRVHEWMPDFLGFWNMSFDVNKMIEALDYYGIDKATVFCDPKVPKEFRHFKWREDSLIKVTADGKRTSKHIADLWHSLTAAASYYCIDLMGLFKRLRVREGQRPSYSLDAILGTELKLSKLKFEEADGLTGLDWHQKMQNEHPIEYLIYNVFDCISVEMLDEKTGDASKGLRAAADISEISRLNSNPKRLSDTMYFILRDEGKVIGSVSSDMTEDLDKNTPNKNGWI